MFIVDFNKVRKAFQSPLTLAPYNLKKEIEGLIDASAFGLAYIAFQLSEDGKYRIIACGSTGLRSA